MHKCQVFLFTIILLFSACNSPKNATKLDENQSNQSMTSSPTSTETVTHNTQFFKGRKYHLTKDDEECYKNSGYSMDVMARCDEIALSLIKKEINQKIKSAKNKDMYTLLWLEDEEKNLKRNCASKSKNFVEANKEAFEGEEQFMEKSNTTACLRDELFQLMKSIK